MPTLIIEQPGSRTGGRIPGRVLIGRLPTNGISLADSSISRLHAWIDQNGDGTYYVADTGSLTGTRVNGRPIERRQNLHDGDVIRVGQSQIVFSDYEDLPEGVEEVNLAGQPPLENVAEAGVLFDCECGAPNWVKAAMIGHETTCRHCGRTIRVPERSGVTAQTIAEPAVMPEPGVPVAAVAEAHGHEAILSELHQPSDPGHADEHGLSESVADVSALEDEMSAPVEGAAVEEVEEPAAEMEEREAEAGTNGEHEARLFERWRPGDETAAPPLPPTEEAAPAAVQTCSVCQTEIAAGEAMTTCPSCGLTFHTGCWEENRGCSAYGCPQVGVLRTEEEIKAETEKTVEEEPGEVAAGASIGFDEDEPRSRFPWEFLFLATSVLGVLMGALAYGVPSMIAALGTLVYLVGFRGTKKRKDILIIALVVCVIGAGVGLWFSHRWYRGWPPVQRLLYKSTWRKML